MTLHVEEWQATYGSPYLVAPDETLAGTATLAEDGDALRAHSGVSSAVSKVAFVDGVRRVEASLYQVDDVTGDIARGVAGAHACGAVLVTDGVAARLANISISRHVIFGSGVIGSLPNVAGGWRWQATSVADHDPEAPLAELQRRMRQAEGQLAETLCADGWFTIVDGPLSFVRSADLPVVGYIKTHHRMLLDPSSHATVAALLGVGQRTSLFAHADRYSAYVRIAVADLHAGPWSGIARLELPQSVGLARAGTTADVVTALLPRFAGIRHRDPRAPQNLQPVGALEKHLRRHLGAPALASRAVRDAVASLHGATRPAPAIP